MLGGFFRASAADVTFPTLKTKHGSFTNVVVMSKTGSDIYIRHERGFGNVKLDDIQDDAALVALGLKAPPVKVEVLKPTTGETTTAVTNAPTAAESSATRYQHQAREKWEWLKQHRPALELTNGLLALGVFVAIHLFFSFCLKLICVKAGYQPGLLIWLPGLQIIPALRAASMSLLWLLPAMILVLALLGLPLLARYGSPALAGLEFLVILVATVLTVVLGWVSQIIWCFKITAARGKSILVAIALLLPVVSLFAFLYLAFSNGDE
ncbi:MAG: hypothetical protein EXS35_03745 [Pedosphaera sp.]|nr:hypothetical protein [Pedosphaera sp.]